MFQSVYNVIPALLAGGLGLAGAIAADVSVPVLTEIPTIDGRLDDASWQALPWYGNFSELRKGTPAPVQSRFQIARTDDMLYLAVELDEPAVDRLKVTSDLRGDSSAIWKDDSVEFSIGNDRNRLRLYKITVNANGVFNDFRLIDDNTGTNTYRFEPEWSSHARIKTGRFPGGWTLEMAIPLGTLELAPDTEARWFGNVGRNRYAGGAVELSSFAPLSQVNHILPGEFSAWNLKDFDAMPYRVAIGEKNDGVMRDPTGKLQYRLDWNLLNQTGKYRIFRTSVELRDAEGKIIGNSVAKTGARQDARSELSSSIALPASGKFLQEIVITDAAGRILRTADRQLELDYAPVTFAVIRPAYRNNLYATMPDKTVEIAVDSREWNGMMLKAELSDGGKILSEQTLTIPGTVKFDGASLPDGDYRVIFSGRKGADKVENSIAIRKLPYVAGEVWLDRRGVTHIDGKPFLPVGSYGLAPDGMQGLNCAVLRSHFRDFDQFQTTVEAGYSTGHYLMLDPFQEFNTQWKNWIYETFRTPQDRRESRLNANQRAMLTAFARRAARIPGILGWYLADEPENSDENPGWYIDVRRILAENDPWHPTIMLNWGEPGMRKYYEGCDILMPDCYPQYFADGSTGKSRECTAQWMKIATALRPTWLMVQISPWPERSRDGKLKGIAPGYDDIRMQFYQAFIHNAKGITMYKHAYVTPYVEARMAAESLCLEALELAEYLLEDTKVDALAMTTAPVTDSFQYGLKRTADGRIAILAVNPTDREIAIAGEFRESAPEQLFVVGEKRAIKVDRRRFSDHLPPFAGRIYLSDGTLAARLPNEAEWRKTIAVAVTALKKPGNLIGLGQMYPADYLEYGGAGKIPSGVAKMRASSDLLVYELRQTGSLYYLINGLTDAGAGFNAWQPTPEDIAPWLEVTLPTPAMVSAVRLYTFVNGGNANLVAGAIDLGQHGQWREVGRFEENAKECIVVNFSPQTAEMVRLRVLKTNPAPAEARMTGRLLSEVEVYGEVKK